MQPGLPFLIHRHKDGKLLVSVTSNKLFHMLQHLLVLGVLLVVYAKPRCTAFIASSSVAFVASSAAS